MKRHVTIARVTNTGVYCTISRHCIGRRWDMGFASMRLARGCWPALIIKTAGLHAYPSCSPSVDTILSWKKSTVEQGSL
jgi:hypothetical protein